MVMLGIWGKGEVQVQAAAIGDHEKGGRRPSSYAAGMPPVVTSAESNESMEFPVAKGCSSRSWAVQQGRDVRLEDGETGDVVEGI